MLWSFQNLPLKKLKASEDPRTVAFCLVALGYRLTAFQSKHITFLKFSDG